MRRAGDENRPPGMRAAPMPAWAGGPGRRRFRRRHRRLRWLVPAVAGLLLGGWLLSPDPSIPASPISGRVQVIDGDTLRHGEWRMRLDGIDAPELRQQCEDGTGEAWQCGVAARDHVADIISGREVSCSGREVDRYGRLVATCTVAGEDLAGRLAADGMAVADGPRYVALSRAAEAAKRGIWAGLFDRPDAWRRANSGDDPAFSAPNRLAGLVNWMGGVFLR